MEEYNDMEPITGSLTAGENGFVHVESIDSALIDGSSINQDDGVVVTRVDTVQFEPIDQRSTEDGGNEEFVDCPDDLISLDGRTDFDENTEPESVLEGQQTFGDSTEILPHHYQEERRQLITELTNTRHQLSQTDDTIRQLNATIDSKDREIEDLNMKAIRILSIFTTVFGEEGFGDTSVSGKLSHIEKNASIMIQKYSHFLYEVEVLNQCLTEVKSDYHMQTDMEKVLFFVREELISLKRKEFELAHKNRYLEDEYGKLMQQLVKSKETVQTLNAEVEVHKTRINNTKEKLNLAVTKGKSLVQQRDSLKQAIVEKTNELDKCLIELQEKSRALEAANSLKEAIFQRDMILENIEEILTSNGVKEEVHSSDIVDGVTWLANERSRLTPVSLKFQKLTDALSSLELPEAAAPYPDFESQVTWLLESFNMAKYEAIKLQDEINTTKEVARVEIDRLTVSLLVEAQEKNYFEEELKKVSEEICVLKDKNGSLQIDLQRSEDKAVSLREKLSMAVKKGKSLVQDRTEKNAQIEALKLELKQQEATTNDYRDQICKLSKDVERIEKLESDLSCLKEERNQIEQFLVESNTLLQHVIEATDDINHPVDITGPVEKVKWCVTYINECQVAKAKVEQELGDVKDEAGMLTRKLTDALTTMKSLEDALSVSEKHVFQLTDENKELKILKTNAEEELHKVKEEVSTHAINLNEAYRTIKSLEDATSQLQTHVSQFSNENEKAKKLKEEAAYHERKFMDAFASVKTLEDALLKAENTISDLDGINKNTEHEMLTLNSQLSACRQELAGKHERVVMLEHDIKVVLSACADVIKEMKLIVDNNILEINSSDELRKLSFNHASDVGAVDDVAVADIKVVEEMLSAARNVRSITEHRVQDLQAELEKNKSMYEKVKEENDLFQNRVFKLETELEALQNVRDEMGIKLVEYQGKEGEWNKRESELSKQITAFMKDHESENDLLSASEINSLFNKINEITIPFPNITSGEIEARDLDPTKKLFYIIDSVNDLLDHITLLSHSKKELQSTLSKQTLETEHLKAEFEETINDKKELEKTKKELFELSVGVECIIRKYGGGEYDADVARLLPLLERFITDIILDSENSKDKAKEVAVKLLDTQKVVEELENKVKMLEDFDQNRDGLLESVHERSGSEASSLPPRSEISEVEDPGSLGKRVTPLVRTLRREPNDHLALSIDPESDHLIDEYDTVEDKGHVFKSLHTSGLVPPQGKILADRLDGIWVSGGRALMSWPRARLGLIAYWVMLHLWLLGTLL